MGQGGGGHNSGTGGGGVNSGTGYVNMRIQTFKDSNLIFEICHYDVTKCIFHSQA